MTKLKSNVFPRSFNHPKLKKHSVLLICFLSCRECLFCILFLVWLLEQRHRRGNIVVMAEEDEDEKNPHI